jgi:hypothetical protein
LRHMELAALGLAIRIRIPQYTDKLIFKKHEYINVFIYRALLRLSVRRKHVKALNP